MCHQQSFLRVIVVVNVNANAVLYVIDEIVHEKALELVHVQAWNGGEHFLLSSFKLRLPILVLNAASAAHRSTHIFFSFKSNKTNQI